MQAILHAGLVQCFQIVMHNKIFGPAMHNLEMLDVLHVYSSCDDHVFAQILTEATM